MGKDRCDNCNERGYAYTVKGASLYKIRRMKQEDRPKRYGEISLCLNCEKTADWKHYSKKKEATKKKN